MRVLSLFSGVGGMDLGLERAGHEVVGMCEIDKHARSVLARHWPDVPIHDDVTTFETEEWRGRVDLVAGGSPCQDLSVAGKRGGLDGERSGLFWHQCRIADLIAAPWFLWENVAGALTSNGGADFAAVLWGITGALPDVPDEGWKSAGVCVGPERTAVWRLLDAQWFGVAQRRRRVFVVAGPRGECGPEVLLESESVSGNPAPSRASREEVAGTIGTRPQRGDLDSHGAYVACEQAQPRTIHNTHYEHIKCDLAPTLDAGAWKGPRHNQQGIAIVESFRGDNLNGWREGVGPVRAAGGDLGGGSETLAVIRQSIFGGDIINGYKEGAGPIRAGSSDANGRGKLAIAEAVDPSRHGIESEPYVKVIRSGARDANGDLPPEVWRAEEVAPTLNQFDVGDARATVAIPSPIGVRRLTPRECERLMGWPDDWTRYTADGKEQADSHRYKQCGNGVVSNVAEWIGRRLP